jgi:hypothetical protein
MDANVFNEFHRQPPTITSDYYVDFMGISTSKRFEIAIEEVSKMHNTTWDGPPGILSSWH